ncbi:hypothetical protein Nepgr_023680 [Nepenthes gracilis]|uniref:Uncharacterized protein n=1 Tax=Nepenthes gracilis TaxID=150966 RepID=A0AAD3XXX6_NEPGR|nr:hypothetical protein Nepgr_023680 [Nepenthes gracilis]
MHLELLFSIISNCSCFFFVNQIFAFCVIPNVCYRTSVNSAPLSGPQMFAEAPAAQKSSTEAIKLEELSRRDQYLVRQRDEHKNSRTPQIAQGHASFSSSLAYEDEPSNTAAAGYAF